MAMKLGIGNAGVAKMKRLAGILSLAMAMALCGEEPGLPAVPVVVYECGFSFRRVPYLVQLAPAAEVSIVPGEAFCGNPAAGPELRGAFLLRLRPLREPAGAVTEIRLEDCFVVHEGERGWTASGREPLQILYRDDAPPLVVVRRYHSCHAYRLWFFVADVEGAGRPLRRVHFSTGGAGTDELLGNEADWVAGRAGRPGSLVLRGQAEAGWGRYLSQFSELSGRPGANAFIRNGLFTEQGGTYDLGADWLGLERLP